MGTAVTLPKFEDGFMTGNNFRGVFEMGVPVVVKAGTNVISHIDPWHARMVQCKCERSMDYVLLVQI